MNATSKWTLYTAIALPLLLPACARYEARPVDLPVVAQSQAASTLDGPAIEAMRMRIAPGAANAAENDRLWLLAAILARDPKVAEARAAIATAQAQAKAQRHVASPVLTLTGEYANDPATSSPWLIGGAVDLPLDIGGRRSTRLREADLGVAIARYDFAETVWAERNAARRALIDRFIAERTVALDTDMLALRDRQLAALSRQAKAGAASAVDAEAARLAREASTRDLALARSQLMQAQAALAAILGVPVATVADLPWRWSDFDLHDTPPTQDVGEDARLAAVTARADVLRALADYDRADATYRGEIARQFPAVTVSPGYTWERGLVKLPLSLGLALPPLDLNRHAIAAAAKARDEVGAHLEQVVATAMSAVDAALAEREQAMAALRDLRARELPVAQAAATRADERLRLGDIGRVEWVDGQAALLDIRRRELDALARAQAADAALEDTLRRPLDGPETAVAVSALEGVQ